MNVVGFLQKYNIPFEHSGKNTGRNWVGVNCPFCGDHGFHGGFNLTSGGWSCWKCGRIKKRSTRSAIRHLTNLSWPEVSEVMENFFKGFGSTGKVIRQDIDKKPFKLPGSLPMKRVTDRYILNRNFDTTALVDKYGLLCGGYDGDYSYRVIIPVWYSGQVVSFQSRDVTNSQKIRYKDCPTDRAIIYHKEILYNLDNCKEDWCIVVEGVFDVWRIGDNACSTFGTGYTESQVALLSDLFDTVFIWFDPGAKAQAAAESLGNSLAALGTGVHIMTIHGDDPADTAPEIVQEIMDQVRSAK